MDFSEKSCRKVLAQDVFILPEIFIQIGYFFQELCENIKVGVFSELSVD